MGISAKLRPTEGDGDGSGALSRELQLAQNWGGADAARANSAAWGRVACGADTTAAADGEDWECGVGGKHYMPYKRILLICLGVSIVSLGQCQYLNIVSIINIFRFLI